ncbi:MAG TPA: LPS export ABC transporter permease LptF [Paracoccaceae bacterium]|nr:LPS export ABC transporter permease LptF [Paracoccaceae bacterium]
MRGLVGKYVILQILGPFGVFSLILLSLVWLTQSLRVIETVVASGQSAATFAAFAALLLPVVISFILPVAAFAATLYALNRMFMDSEIVALMAAGMSRLRLARPVLVFGLGVTLAMAVVTTYLMPTAARELRGRMAELGADVAGALLREGEFIHPASGVSVYVRAVGPDGQMAGLFVQDDRDPDVRVTYTAERAALVRTEAGPRLVMFDGAAQRLERGASALSLLSFEKLVYDLAQLMPETTERRLKPSEYHAPALVAPSAAMLDGRPPGEFVAEGHEQLSAPLYAVALPLIGLASLLGPGFRRRGYGKRLAAAVALAALCRLLGVAAKSATGSLAALWPAMYAPPLIGAALALLVLWKGLPSAAGRGLPAASGEGAPA